jgi:ABC-type uncharacterized transport system substrate-binding protein
MLKMVLMLLFCQPVYAIDKVNILYNESNISSRLFKKQLITALRSYDIDYAISDLDRVTDVHFDEQQNNETIFITLGSKALYATWKKFSNKKIFSLLVSQEKIKKITASSPYANQLYGLYLEQSLNRQLLLAQQLIPGIHSIGFLTTPDNFAELQKQLTYSPIDAAFEIQTVRDQKSLGRALSHIIQTSELLITLAKPEIYNRSSLRNILLSSYRNNIPLIGLNKAFVDAGCLAAVYTTSEQFAQETAGIVNKAIVGGTLAKINYAKYYEVSLNHKVARSLGLYLQSEEKILSVMHLKLEEGSK